MEHVISFTDKNKIGLDETEREESSFEIDIFVDPDFDENKNPEKSALQMQMYPLKNTMTFLI